MYERTYKSKVLSTQQAPQEKKRKKRFPLKRALWIGGTIAVLVGMFFLIRLPQLQVRDIEVEGTTVADPEDVSLFVRSQIEGRVLYALPRTSMLLVPAATIAKRLEAQFPRFRDVDVRRKGLHGLSVTVNEHEGARLWCANDEECFFMTEEGIVFAPAPFFSGDAYERIFYGELKPLPFVPFEASFLSLLQTAREKLPAIGIVPREYRFVSEHQLDIVFSHQGSSATLMIDYANDIDKTLEDLATGLSTDPLKGEFNSGNRTLEYLDARFANKVVYKFK